MMVDNSRVCSPISFQQMSFCLGPFLQFTPKWHTTQMIYRCPFVSETEFNKHTYLSEFLNSLCGAGMIMESSSLAKTIQSFISSLWNSENGSPRLGFAGANDWHVKLLLILALGFVAYIIFFWKIRRSSR